jgi:hypothetical protein
VRQSDASLFLGEPLQSTDNSSLGYPNIDGEFLRTSLICFLAGRPLIFQDLPIPARQRLEGYDDGAEEVEVVAMVLLVRQVGGIQGGWGTAIERPPEFRKRDR